MPALTGPTFGPKSGAPAQQLIVLCHGYGSDGNDLIDLAPLWARYLPNALFTSPHAPEPFEDAPFGRQWFSLHDRSRPAMDAGVRQAAVSLNAYLDETLAALNLPADAYALMGFSQGAMTSLYTGLRRATPPRAILAFSGNLLGANSLASELSGKPPVLLVHGEQDPVVPVEASRVAERTLSALGVPVQAIYPPALQHGIEETGITAAGELLRKVFKG
jgi:phospholipase/carboxylesterase